MTPDEAADLLSDLAANFPEVVLVPSRRPEEAARGGCIRVAIAFNPEWYKRLCHAHQKRRLRRTPKSDTRVVRSDVLRVLGRVAAGKQSKSFIILWLDTYLNKHRPSP